MKLKLGAIVTNMAGSAGGQSVRRFRGGHILQNKAQYVRNDKVYSNRQLPMLAQTFRAWGSLSSAVKIEWNYQASIYQFLDKFGQITYITGRQLFSKLTINCNFIGETPPEPATINSVVNNATIDGVVAQTSPDILAISMTSIGGATKVSVSGCRLKSETDFINLSKLYQLGVMELDGSDSLSVTSAWIARFGEMIPGQAICIMVRPYNIYGFRGATVVYKTTIVSGT